MAEAPKRCHYEVLGVSRDATADEIRAAYRRLALQLHPDKRASSGVSPGEATAAFQELLQSYEVLSDPKERAWYDSHRSQILFSDPKSHRSSSPFFDLDLYAFFSASCFSGFSDSGKGFYKVYGDAFSKIHSQELYFTEKMGLGLDSVAPAPLIGNLDSPYAQVTAFYNYWLAFSTAMDFAWVDEYDASSGPNRRSRRFMEEENKKIRKKAKRERNELVRGLAAFAKKRDKRVIDMTIKKTQEEEKRRAEEKAKRKEEEKRKLERARMYEEPEWAKIHENEEEVSFDEFDDARKKEKGGEEFYCVVCNKKFKSDKQWKNHEQSKKHKEKVAELKDAFKEEDEVFEDAADGVESVRVEFDFEMPPEDSDDPDEIDELCEELRDEVVLENEEKGEDSDEKIGSYDEASILEAMVNGLKNREGDRGSFHDSSFNKNFGHDHLREDAREQHQENSVEDREEGSSDSFEDPVARNKGIEGDGKSKRKHKKQQVVGKRYEKKVEDPGAKNKGRKQKGSSKASSNTCGTCGHSFDSRNKLFAHLGDTGHAMLKTR